MPDQPVILWILLLNLLEDRTYICLLLVLRMLSSLPWPSKDDQDWPCNDTGQCPQCWWCISRSHGLLYTQVLEMAPNLVFLALDFPTGTGNLGFLKTGFTHKDQGKKISSLVFPISSVTSFPVQFLIRPINLLPFFFWWCSWRILLHYVPHWIQFWRILTVHISFLPVLWLFPPGFEVVLSLQTK